MKLPSERIKEILKTPEGDFWHTETSAILAYLDETAKDKEVCEHNKLKQVFKCEDCGEVV